jgi:threonyl-tRNA synthetase
MLILGDEEMKDGSVSIRSRDGNQKNGVPLEQFVSDIYAEISNRTKDLSLVE